jgi:hypothetical protein
VAPDDSQGGLLVGRFEEIVRLHPHRERLRINDLGVLASGLGEGHQRDANSTARQRSHFLTITVPEPKLALHDPPEKEIQLRCPPDGTTPKAILGFSLTDMRKSKVRLGAGIRRSRCGGSPMTF